MAPRRSGGSGGSSSGSSSSCPGAFSDTISQVYFGCIVVFLAVFLGIAIAFCTVRKRSGVGKKLLGAPYVVALLLWIIAYALDLVGSVLRECGTVDLDSYYSLSIATSIFYYLAYYALLFVVAYTLNIMLRSHLGGSIMPFKIILLAILAIMFALSCAIMGVNSYNNWTQTSAGYDADAELLMEPAERLRVAYSVLFLLSVLISGGLSLITIFAMRSRRLAGGDLLGWVVTLIFSMVVWVLLQIVFAAAYLQDSYEILDFTTQVALLYVQSFFQALSFIILLCIAKHASWNSTAAMDATQSQPMYAYGNTNGQPAYIHEAPAYVGQKH